MQPLGQRNSQIIPLLLLEEKKLNSPGFLTEALKPNSSTSQLLDSAWKEISELTGGQEVRTAIKACETLAKKILRKPPNSLNETFKLTFMDSESLEISHLQLIPLLADSPVLKAMLERPFKEGCEKKATLETISKETFVIMLRGGDQPLTPTILLDVLEAGCFLLNPFIIRDCLAKLKELLKAKNWDNAINPGRLIDLTLNHSAQFKTCNVDMKDLVSVIEKALVNCLKETFERLRQSTPSLFNFYTSSFDAMLKKWNELVDSIQRIDGRWQLKENLNELILRKVRQLHLDYRCQLLGTVENTIKILKGLQEAGYPTDIVKDLIRECSDDLRTYHSNQKEISKAWSDAIQKGI